MTVSLVKKKGDFLSMLEHMEINNGMKIEHA